MSENRITRIATSAARLLILLAVIAGMISVNSCATLEKIIQKPTVTFSGMQLTNADLVQSTAVFNFGIDNPNPINIRANRITYDLKLNGRDFVNGRLDQGVSLSAGGTSNLQVPVTLAYLDFFDSIGQMLRTKSVDYDLTGGFTVGPFVIPYRARGTFDLPRMPKISLEAIKITKLSLFGASLNARLKMENPNAFDFLFKRLDYALNLGGKPFGQLSALPQGPVGKHSQSFINFAFDVSFAQLGHSAYQLLQGGKADYSLNGGMIFDQPGHGERKVPLNLSGRVPFLR